MSIFEHYFDCNNLFPTLFTILLAIGLLIYFELDTGIFFFELIPLETLAIYVFVVLNDKFELLFVTYGLNTFYWVIILFCVTFPVTSFLFRGGTYLGMVLTFDGSFNLFDVGIGGFFYTII